MQTNTDHMSPRDRGEQASPAVSGRNLSGMPVSVIPGERRCHLLSGSAGVDDPAPAGLPFFRARPALVQALEGLLNLLPPDLTRREACEVIPGLITENTLRNADSRGRGPRRRRYDGRGVVYPTPFFLEWLEDRFL